jgi:hypothetical protein
MKVVTRIDTGTGDQRDQGEQPGDPEHEPEHPDDHQQRRDQLGERLLQSLRDVVGVVGGPAQHLAARLLVEVRQRQPGQLRLDVLPQPVDGLLHHDRGEPALEDAEQPGRQIDDHHPAEQVQQLVEIDALTRREIDRGEQVGARVLAAGAQLVDDLLLAQARRDRPADHAGEDDVGGVAEQARAGDGERHAADAEQQHEADQGTLRLEQAQQALGGALEVVELLGRPAGSHHHPGDGRSAYRRPGPARGRGHAMPPKKQETFARSRHSLRSVMPRPPVP